MSIVFSTASFLLLLTFKTIWALDNSFELGQKCFYGERGSLTAVCSGVTSTSFFKGTSYNFDHLDETLICKNCVLPILKTATFDLPGNRLKNIVLKRTSIRELQQRAFLGLIFVETIDLSSNNIQKIEKGTFEGIRKLKVLNLSNNSLELLEDDRFKELFNLETLLLNSNKIKFLNSNSFNGLTNLRTLDLNLNYINNIYGAFNSVPVLESLDLSNNKISNLTEQQFQGLESLYELKLKRNLISVIPALIFVQLPNVRLLDLADNKIVKLEKKSLDKLESLEMLDLSNNLLTEIPPGTFSNLYSLLYINMTNNALSEFSTNIYSGLPELMNINVSYNKIRVINPIGKFALHNVHTLDLSYNLLEDVDLGRFLIRLPKISLLCLQGNKWYCKWKNFLHVHAIDNLRFRLADAKEAKKNCSKDDTFVFEKYYTSKKVHSTNNVDDYYDDNDAWIYIALSFLFLIISCLFFVQYRTYKAVFT